MTNGIGHRVIAISRIFLKDQWKFLPWWLLSKSEYNVILGIFYQLLSTQNVNKANLILNETFSLIFKHCVENVDVFYALLLGYHKTWRNCI